MSRTMGHRAVRTSNSRRQTTDSRWVLTKVSATSSTVLASPPEARKKERTKKKERKRKMGKKEKEGERKRKRKRKKEREKKRGK